MIINPLDVLLWTFRRSERDVVRLYEALSPVMTLATGGRMLNFGLWEGGIEDPLGAQENLCRAAGRLAELGGAGTVVDAGSGLGAPADLWAREHGDRIVSVNTSLRQLLDGAGDQMRACSSATRLPLADGCADRVIALESAQHFRPLGRFASESARVLRPGGLLVAAVPVASGPAGLGMLRYTWSSEHYTAAEVSGALKGAGLEVISEEMVGGLVYPPLAGYYMRERARLRTRILAGYPGYVEGVLNASMARMGRAYDEGAIDYLMIKCRAGAG